MIRFGDDDGLGEEEDENDATGQPVDFLDDIDDEDEVDDEPVVYSFRLDDPEAVRNIGRLLDEAGVTYELDRDELRAPAEAAVAVDNALDHLDRLLGIAPAHGEITEIIDLAVYGDGDLDRLEAELRHSRVPHRWDDDGDLLVPKAARLAAEELLDRLGVPADADDEEGGDPQLLGDLFVAVDRLVHEPMNVTHQVELGEATDRAVDSAPPYGVERMTWRRIVAAVEAACDAIAVENPDEETIRALCEEAHTLLRPLV